ncbi:Uncharacterised protein [uncultured archaeon]|nr:Uncharacterised protein [uncultured archaeon]
MNPFRAISHWFRIRREETERRRCVLVNFRAELARLRAEVDARSLPCGHKYSSWCSICSAHMFYNDACHNCQCGRCLECYPSDMKSPLKFFTVDGAPANPFPNLDPCPDCEHPRHEGRCPFPVVYMSPNCSTEVSTVEQCACGTTDEEST